MHGNFPMVRRQQLQAIRASWAALAVALAVTGAHADDAKPPQSCPAGCVVATAAPPASQPLHTPPPAATAQPANAPVMPPAGNVNTPPAPAPAVPPATPVAQSPASLGCVFVLGVPAPGASASAVTTTLTSASASQACTTDQRVQTPLVGHGDLVVVALQKDWLQLTAAAAATGSIPKLFINGVLVDGTAAFRGTENRDDGTVWIRFQVNNDKSTREFWMSQMRIAGLSKPVPLRAAIGFGANATTLATPDRDSPTIQVTSWELAAIAVVLIALCLVGFVKLVRDTSYFRDGPPLAAGAPATYSLARVQSGVWLLFIVSAGLYIAVVLAGQLPPIEPTLVGMLAVSATTSVASIAIDQNAAIPVQPSKGFWKDILTGWNDADKQQLHRLQAVYVNGLLLLVGIWNVYDNVAFPVFDASWLALLGVSGVTQATLKQVLETGSAAATTIPPPPASSASVPNIAVMPPPVLPQAPPQTTSMPQL